MGRIPVEREAEHSNAIGAGIRIPQSRLVPSSLVLYCAGMRNQPFHDELAPVGNAQVDSGKRIPGLTLLFAAGFFVVLSRLAWVQNSLQDGYLKALDRTTVTYESIPARNGRIVGENGTVYAEDVDEFTIQVHYRWLQSPLHDSWLRREVRRRLTRAERRDESLVAECEAEIRADQVRLWEQLSQLTGLSPQELAQRRSSIQDRVAQIASAVNAKHFQEPTRETLHEDGLLVRIASDIRSALTTEPKRTTDERIVVLEEESWHDVVVDCGFEIRAVIEEQPHRFPGVRVRSQYRRHYPQGHVAAHLIGARTLVREEEVPDSTRKEGEQIGRFGLEKSWNAHLRCRPGRRKVVRNRRLEIVESTVIERESAGRDLVVTLDYGLQKFAENLLDEAVGPNVPGYLAGDAEDASDCPQALGGAVVVMECSTGRLVVGASAPSYSLGLFVHSRQADWDALNADSRSPQTNRILTGTTPGRLMTPVTAIAAINAGVLDPDYVFQCSGFLGESQEHACSVVQGHGGVRLREALAGGCRIYFQNAALQTGSRRMVSWKSRFGFGSITGSDLPGEASCADPAIASSRAQSQLLANAVGRRMKATPLQLARMMAAIANGGVLVTPHVGSHSGLIDEQSAPAELVRSRIPELGHAESNAVAEGLRAGAGSTGGAVYKWLHPEKISVAAIAATIDSTSVHVDVPTGLVAGYFPADAPRYSFAAVLEHGGEGHRHVAPLVAQIIKRMYPESP
mgnify:CR=1 FL=1